MRHWSELLSAGRHIRAILVVTSALVTVPASAQSEQETYYEWIGVETLPGYSVEFGTPDALAGCSENGRYMWSEAAADPTDADEPYLVVDGELHYLWEYEGLSGLLVDAINSDGLSLATALDGGRERLLVTDLQNLAARTYLDELELTGDPGFDPTIASPAGLTDGWAVLVQTPVPGSAAMQLWIVRDRVVSKLWQADPALGQAEHLWQHLAYGRILIDTNAGDEVIGYSGLTESELRPMLWSPQTGAVDLSDLTQVGSINDDGTIYAGQRSRLVLWRDGEIEWTGTGDDREYDGQYGSSFAPAGRAGDGVRLMTQINRGPGGSGIHTYFAAKSPWNPVTLLEQEDRPIDPPGIINEAGLVLDGRAGWFEKIATADAVTGIGGARVFMRANDHAYRIETSTRRDRRLTFVLGQYGGRSWSLTSTSPGINDYFQGDLFDDPSGAEQQVYRSAEGVFMAGPDRYELWGEPQILPGITAFSRPNGFFVVAGTTDTGELRLIYDSSVQYIYMGGAHYTQTHVSLTDQLAGQGLAPPVFASNLDSFITPWGAMNIVGLDAAGDLHAVWWSPALGSPLWTTNNLSAITGAPPLVGNISANATRWNGMQIFGTDARGHLIVVWWSPPPAAGTGTT
ncbi:MAG: hypothetical protein IPJ41_02855 [Phycisphaerales bacterium]|nr:hypothetical protein [Phycisphaerales bacterium]